MNVQKVGTEYERACRKGEERKSAVAEHAWKEHLPFLYGRRPERLTGPADNYRELGVKALLVSPMYTFPQLQGILITMLGVSYL